jgi:hypothetical protein
MKQKKLINTFLGDGNVTMVFNHGLPKIGGGNVNLTPKGIILGNV